MHCSYNHHHESPEFIKWRERNDRNLILCGFGFLGMVALYILYRKMM
jgi:hypothetical protein